MQTAGFDVPRPRSTQEPFHTTLGVVDPSVAPVGEILAALNGNITTFSPVPVVIDGFDLLFPPVHIAAHNGTVTMKRIMASRRDEDGSK